MSRNYRKEYDNYHSRPEQKIRRAARNAARKLFADAAPDKDVHHKDNNPLNNDKKNLSLVTQHYNRKEPRIREKKLKLQQALKKEAFTSAPGMTAVVHNGEIVAKGSKSAMTKKFKELKKKYPKDAGRARKLKLVSAPGSKYKVGGVWKEKNIKEDAAAAADLKAKQAAEVDALKSKQEGEVEGLKAKHEREGERQKKQDEGEAEAEKARDAREEVKEGKYLKYSDLLFAKSKLIDKEGPNSPAVKKIDKAIAKEMQRLGIEGIWVKTEDIQEAPLVVGNEISALEMVAKKFEEILRKSDFKKKQKLASTVGIKLSRRGSSFQIEDMGTVTGTHKTVTEGVVVLDIKTGKAIAYYDSPQMAKKFEPNQKYVKMTDKEFMAKYKPRKGGFYGRTGRPKGKKEPVKGLWNAAEDMGTTTGPHISGTGDDNSTVVVKKKKKKKVKVYKRESLKKRIIDNVLAIQQKV